MKKGVFNGFRGLIAKGTDRRRGTLSLEQVCLACYPVSDHLPHKDANLGHCWDKPKLVPHGFGRGIGDRGLMGAGCLNLIVFLVVSWLDRILPWLVTGPNTPIPIFNQANGDRRNCSHFFLRNAGKEFTQIPWLSLLINEINHFVPVAIRGRLA